MSGIAGIWRLDGRPVDAAALTAMAVSLAHRGPDGSGVWIGDAVGFAHRMLWTTPESLAEKQPLTRREGGFVITADARIDNRDDLRRMLDLDRRDDVGDSELILAAYAEWGESCPEKLVGDFAFAIWDEKRRMLFAARDRIGVKPFYYCHEEGRAFAFASEISPLFRATGLEKRADQDAIREFAALAPPFERTLFEGIRRLPPACRLVLRDGSLLVRSYWRPESARETRAPGLAKHAEEFRHLFTEAVRAQTRSAFPIGCLLGGGLDSSTVLCIASRIAPHEASLSGFSMIFDRLPCDEREFIAQCIRESGAEWFFSVADARAPDGSGDLRACCGAQADWPLQGVPLQPFLPLLDEARKRGARVMLTGFGGDHLLQGSAYYLADLLASLRWRRLAEELKHHRFSRHVLWYWMLEPLLPEGIGKLGRRIRNFIEGESDVSSLLGRGKQSSGRERPELARTRFGAASAWQEANALADPRTSVSLESWWDVLGHRGGLEFRHPFFDARVVDFLLSIPAEEKRREGTTKLLLREATKGILPEAIRLRRGKAEFSPIVDAALASMTFDPRSLALTRSGIIEENDAARVIERRNARPSPLSSLLLWQLAALEDWYVLHFDPTGGQA